MIYSIKDCIEYVHDAGKITEMLHADLLNELEDLYESNGILREFIYKDNILELEKIITKQTLLFSKRHKIAKEYEKWCKDNNAVVSDTTNMITWCFNIKLREWINKVGDKDE